MKRTCSLICFYLRQLPAWLAGEPEVRKEWAWDAYLVQYAIGNHLRRLAPGGNCEMCGLRDKRWWRRVPHTCDFF